nr:MAG TPA: hypothetical protein [Bacteriophage sp.]
MKLTRNEILILINHYNGLEFDLEDRMDKFENTYIGLIDNDLFVTQRKRYKTMIGEYESRINELQTELDKL